MCKTLNRKYIYKYGEKKEDVEIVENMLNRMRNSGTFKGENFANIYYEKYIVEESDKAIVICHGFSECIEKYHEIIYYFLNEGFSVYIMEHRGHGRSGCLSKSCNTQVEVESFDYYVKDLKTFLNEIVLKDKRFNNNLYLKKSIDIKHNNKSLLLASSLGALYTVVSIFPKLKMFSLFPFQILVAWIMIRILWKRNNFKVELKATGIYILIAFLLSGISFGFSTWENKYSFEHSYVISNASMQYLLISIILVYIISDRVLSYLRERALNSFSLFITSLH